MMMAFKEIGRALKLAKMSRNPGELFKLMVPASKRQRQVLNERPAAASSDSSAHESVDAQDVIKRLKSLRNELKQQAYVESGAVDYAALAKSETYTKLQEATQDLRLISPEDLEGDDQKIAFFINLYNVLMIHGVIALEIEESVMEVPTFFTVVAYQVGDDLLTPDEIEHGILRLNAAHPSSGARCFEPQDPKLRWLPSRLEPRIHMALVCVAQSCPPIAFYDADRLETQLEMASYNFVSGSTQVSGEAREVELSSIFKFYGHDFGAKQELAQFLIDHTDPPLHDELKEAVEHNYEWVYSEYDWSLNSI